MLILTVYTKPNFLTPKTRYALIKSAKIPVLGKNPQTNKEGQLGFSYVTHHGKILNIYPHFLTYCTCVFKHNLWNGHWAVLGIFLRADGAFDSDPDPETMTRSRVDLDPQKLEQGSIYGLKHRVNMEVVLQSLFGLHVTWCAQLHSLAEAPQSPPLPEFGLDIRVRYWSAKIDDISL